jgi:hypothetical protein
MVLDPVPHEVPGMGGGTPGSHALAAAKARVESTRECRDEDDHVPDRRGPAGSGASAKIQARPHERMLAPMSCAGQPWSTQPLSQLPSQHD